MVQEAAVPPAPPCLPLLFSPCFPSSIWVMIPIRRHVEKILYMFEGENVPPVLFCFLPICDLPFLLQPKPAQNPRIRKDPRTPVEGMLQLLLSTDFVMDGQLYWNLSSDPPATMFSSPWSTINFISEPFAEESRGGKMSPRHAAVWEEMVGVWSWHGQCTVKS